MQSDRQTSERRRHQRMHARLPVRISTIEPERDSWTGRPFFRASQETSGNVSRGGAFVKTAEPLAPGQRVLVELALPGGAPLEAIGRVAWQRRVMTPRGGAIDAGVGIEFLGGASERFGALEDYLDAEAHSAEIDGNGA